MDFLILRPLPPKTGYHFLRGGGGGGGGWGGGGQKFLLKRLQAVGKHSAHHTVDGPTVTQPTQGLRSAVLGLLTFGAGGGAKVARPGFEPPTANVASDALPLGHCVNCAEGRPRCLGPHLPLTKNPNCVYLSDCLPACWLRD